MFTKCIILEERINAMEKTLNIEEMVKEYTSTTNKVARDKFMEKVQVEPYIGYAAKIVYAKRIVESTAWNDDNGKIEIDSPIRYILYNYTLISVYTNIEMHKESMLAEYDALQSCGLKDKILEKIPTAEKVQFDYVLKMVSDDYYTNHFETHAYIDSLVDRFRNIVENFFSPISEELVHGLDKLSSEEVANAITGAVAQIGSNNVQDQQKADVKKSRTRKSTKKVNSKQENKE